LEVLRQAWHKYGLIVVGNVVFFALLYFIRRRRGETRLAAAALNVALDNPAIGINRFAW
jgi:hypothetical protein